MVHGLNLRLYLRHGLKLVKLHRGIVFYQEKYMRGFIDKCATMRACAPSPLEAQTWKDICNSVYGKVRWCVSLLSSSPGGSNKKD